MTCKCGSERILSVNAKCSDLCATSYFIRHADDDEQIEEIGGCGYVPDLKAIGGGDYIDIEICLDCGTLQGFETLSDEVVREAIESA